jgi:hypothetical protein
MARRKMGRADAPPIISEEDRSLDGRDWNEQMTTALFAREARSVLVK